MINITNKAVAEMNTNASISLLITDDHRVFRETLLTIFRKIPGIQVVGEAENGLVAVEKTSELHPDIVLMDVRMPVLDGVNATRRIKQASPDTIVIALSNDTDEYYIDEMKSAGAADYLSKSIDIDGLEQSIRRAYAGSA